MDVIKAIRESNEAFVKNENFQGVKKVIVDNYSDRAHFIYELLQNADDVSATEIRFILESDRMIVRHNGKPFTEENVRAICSISRGTKADDYTKIGRFGIGFKSVFAYTNNPLIFSKNYNFEISELVLPRRRHKTVVVGSKETVFILPFNNPKTKAVAFDQINEKLHEVSTDALLFLSHITKISIETASMVRTIERTVESTDKFQKDTFFEDTKITVYENGAFFSENRYFMFRKNNITLTDTDDNGKNVPVYNQSVMIAFINRDGMPVPFSSVSDFHNGREGYNCLYVFFPTMIRTNFEYLIHAPFVTKSSRDTIAQNNPANTQLMKEIGILAADSMLIFSRMHSPQMKQNINDLFFAKYNEGTIWNAFVEEMTKLLRKDKPLIPCDDGKFYDYKATMFTSESPDFVKEIVSLVKKEYLANYCKIKRDETGICTYDDKNLYYKFLKPLLPLRTWTIAGILNKIEGAYLEQQNSNWFVKLVKLIVEKDDYYRNTYRVRYHGVDRLPLLRLAGGKHITQDQADHVYMNNGSLDKNVLMSPEVRYLYSEVFHIGEYSVEREEADAAIAQIIKRGDKISFVKHKELLKIVIVAVESGKYTKAELENQAFLFAINGKTNERKLVCPKDARLWIWQKHSHGQDINIKLLLSGVDTFVIDEKYKDVFEPEDLRKFGCLEGLSVTDVSRDTDTIKNAIYKNAIGLESWIYMKPHSKHAQNRQFKPYFHIEFLDEILATKINLKKSLEILKLVRPYESQIKDFVEWSSNKTFNSASKVYGYGEKYSAFGLALKTSAWVCNGAYHVCMPGQVTERSLPEEYRKLGFSAIDFLKRLGLKEDKEEEMRKLNEDLKKRGMYVIPLAEQQAFAEYQRVKAEKKAKDEKRRQIEEETKTGGEPSKNTPGRPASTVVQDILERKKKNAQHGPTDNEKTSKDRDNRTNTSDPKGQDNKQKKFLEAMIDEDEYLPRSIDYVKILQKAIEDSAEEIEKLEKIDQLQKLLAESEKYSYSWFSTLLEMELSATETNSMDNREITIMFAKVEIDPNSRRTLLLKNPGRSIPQFVEELTDIPLYLKYGDLTKKVVIENASVSSYTLKAKLREEINPEELNVSGIKEAYLEAQSPAFLMKALQEQFLQLGYDGTFSMKENLCQNIEFVFGPPGTGKTTYLAKNVILPLVNQAGPARVLVLTPTNKAADVLVRRIMSFSDERDSLEWLIRFGGTNDELIEDKGLLKEKELDVRDMKHSVTVTTIARFTYDYFMPKKERLYLDAINWDFIIIDEASMIPLVNIIYPLYKKTPKQFIIAGDPFQIEPITAVELWKKENIYTMVGLNSFTDVKTEPHDYKVTRLMTQYRSLPAIGSIFSNLTYDGQLLHHRNADSARKLNLQEELAPLSIIKFPVSQYESIYTAKRLQKRSAYQVYSALFSFEYAKYLAEQIDAANKGENFRIGIIAPYRAESDIIQKLVASEIHNEHVDIQVGTIHGFQGDECDIIIAVFNTPPYISASPEMFLNKMNIINVSISRAKDHLIIIMPDENTENINNLKLVKRVERLFMSQGCKVTNADEMEMLMFGEKDYIEKNSFSTGHQNVNVYGLPEKKYEIRTEEGAVDIQVH